MSAYIVIAALVALGVALMIWRRGSTGARTAEQPAAIYLGLREKMLSITPAEMEIAANGDAAVVYGVIMDLGMAGGTATIVSLATGDTSMYTSRGGGVLGGIGHESCRKASANFIAVAQTFATSLSPAPDHSLPASGMVRFYLLTTRGLLVAEAKIDAVSGSGARLAPLFAAGDNVITQIRLTAPDYGAKR